LPNWPAGAAIATWATAAACDTGTNVYPLGLGAPESPQTAGRTGDPIQHNP